MVQAAQFLFATRQARHLHDVFQMHFPGGLAHGRRNTAVIGDLVHVGLNDVLDRLTYHVHILEMNGETYRLASSQKRARKTRANAESRASKHAHDNEYQRHRLIGTVLLCPSGFATHAGQSKTQIPQHGTGSQEPNLSNRLAPYYTATVTTYSAPFILHRVQTRCKTLNQHGRQIRESICRISQCQRRSSPRTRRRLNTLLGAATCAAFRWLNEFRQRGSNQRQRLQARPRKCTNRSNAMCRASSRPQKPSAFSRNNRTVAKISKITSHKQPSGEHK